MVICIQTYVIHFNYINVSILVNDEIIQVIFILNMNRIITIVVTNSEFSVDFLLNIKVELVMDYYYYFLNYVIVLLYNFYNYMP